MNTGLIGTGYWGKIIQSKLIKYSNLIEIQNSKNFDIRKFKGLNWVFIATPVESHYDLTKLLLKYNVNIFVEKPFCINYFQAYDLIQLSKEKNLKIYVDNLFLLRKEFIYNKKKLFNSKTLHFVWYKNGPFKSTLIDDLLYHDLYMLVELFGVDEYKDLVIFDNEDNVLKFSMKYKSIKVVFDYNRTLDYKIKKIICENSVIEFLNDKQDPLNDIIKMCLNDKIDINRNNSLNLKTMMLFEDIKNALING